MRIGIQYVLPHSSPEQWAEETANMGFRASVFPVDYTAPVSLIDAYVKAAEARDILIAEVGVWASPFSTDEKAAAKAREVAFMSIAHKINDKIFFINSPFSCDNSIFSYVCKYF